VSNLSAISWREQIRFRCDDDDVRFLLDQHAELNFHNASSPKQHSVGRDVSPPGHIILTPNSPDFGFCHICNMLRGEAATKKNVPILHSFI
jgi:hypothetical protein